MSIKKLPLIMLMLALIILATACGNKDSAGKFFLTSDEVNFFTLKENPENLENLGTAMNGTENMIVALDAPSSAHILNSLNSIGKIEATNLSLDFNLNGEGDFQKLAALSSIKGLTSLTIAGINEFNDTSVFTSLKDLTTLTLKDQKIADFTPLSKCPALTTLSLSGATIDYKTLINMKIANIESPVTDNNWVALHLLKNNPNLATINTVNKDTFTVSEFLEPEQKYYNFQFEQVPYLTAKKAEITNIAAATQPVIDDTMAVAAPPGLLQPGYYNQQAMLKTACGISEDENNPKIFFPYIQDYATAGDDSTYLKLGSTAYMAEKFITAVGVEEAKYIAYVYATDKDGNFTTDYAAGQTWVYAQIYNIKDNTAYEPSLIYQSVLGGPEQAANYQGEIINALNQYLSGLSVNTL